MKLRLTARKDIHSIFDDSIIEYKKGDVIKEIDVNLIVDFCTTRKNIIIVYANKCVEYYIHKNVDLFFMNY